MKLTDLCLWKKVNNQREEDKKAPLCTECPGMNYTCSSYLSIGSFPVKYDKEKHLNNLVDYLSRR